MEPTHTPSTVSPTLPTRKLIVITALLFVVGVLIAGGALFKIAGHLDEQALQRSHFYAQRALATREDASRKYITGYAYWTAAYEHLNGQVDLQWAYTEKNLGDTLFTHDGYDGVFVVDGATTRYAMIQGQLTTAPIEQWLHISVADLVHSLRAQADPTQPVTRHALFDGRPAIVTAELILPNDDRPAVDLDTASVLVLVDQLNAGKLLSLGSDFGLSSLSLANTPATGEGPPRLALDPTGLSLSWQAERPGTQMLLAMLPPMALAAVLLAVLLMYFLRLALRSAQELDLGYHQLSAANRALQASEDRFRAVAEASSDWIWETDALQGITYLSQRFTDVTGYSHDLWLGRHLSQLLDCETTPIGPWLMALNERLHITPLRCSYRDSAGLIRYSRVSARPIVGEAGVLGFRGTASDITDEVAAHAQIQHMALHDVLTGLANRHKLSLHLAEALALQERAPHLTLLLLNLDNFKPVNDSLGHPAGDALLREVALRLRESIREHDLVARLGSDEFAMVLTGLQHPEEIDRFCQRLIDDLRRPVLWHTHILHIGASLGIARSSPQQHDSEELIRCADLALYQAKADGKNTWRYFAAHMDERIQHRRRLETELRQAITEQQLILYFQPRYRTTDQVIVAVEALVRWEHPLEGLRGPDSFIPLAEQTGLIVTLGLWVLREACETALQWPASITVSVNLSPAQFAHGDVVRDVREILLQTRFPAARLELEITENVMLNDVEGALATMIALKELGVRLNMDDFGTGYSSLGYLRSYPFDGIKIDKRFVASMTNGHRDRAVVQAIISLGKAMGLTVTAEGVETRQQLDLLREDLCDEVQGYFLSRPINPLSIHQLLKHAPAPSDERRLKPVNVPRSQAH